MNIQLSDSVKSAVDYIIRNENYNKYPEINVTRGSETGDGYASTTYAISIKDTKGKTTEIFLKCFQEEANGEWKEGLTRSFRAEVNFYRNVYPSFCKFQERRNIKKSFNNVPKYYRTNKDDWEISIIGLENLKSLGYTLRDKTKPIDDEHLKLSIQAFARYHAISYAMKDQEPEEFHKLSANIVDYFATNYIKFGMDKMIADCVNQFLDTLDPVSDKKFLDHCADLSNVLTQHTLNVPQNIDEYAVIGKGDCWSNNMMFLYCNNTGLPIDVKLIDWQALRVNSPLLDFSYLFYTIATKEILDNAEYYLNFYYEVLSQRIKKLGSDPEKSYPHRVFIEHWRKFALFGLAMAFLVVKGQLFEKDEVPDLINTTFSIVIKHQNTYVSRIKDIVEYFIDKEFL